MTSSNRLVGPRSTSRSRWARPTTNREDEIAAGDAASGVPSSEAGVDGARAGQDDDRVAGESSAAVDMLGSWPVTTAAAGVVEPPKSATGASSNWRLTPNARRRPG